MAEPAGSTHHSTSGGLVAEHVPQPMPAARFAPTFDDKEHNTLRKTLVPFACWRAEDLRFDFASSFVRPEISDELSALKDLIDRHTLLSLAGKPEFPPVLSVFGHADPTGADDFNKSLSGRRAQAIYGLLTRKVDLWEDLYSHPLGDDDWKSGAVTSMQTALGDSPAPASDKGTRQTLFRRYMDHLCTRRDAAGQPVLDETGAVVQLLVDPKHFLAGGTDKDGKGDFQGCGEFNPVLMLSHEEQKRFSDPKNKEERDLENAPNRRVVVFLFRPGSVVDAATWPCPRAKEGSGGCRKRFWSDAAERRKFTESRRVFEETHDTFACRFYDRISNSSPCENLVIERSMPTLFRPVEPGAKEIVEIRELFAYVVMFKGATDELESAARFLMVDGKFFDEAKGRPAVVVSTRDVWLYFSNRNDLLTLDKAKFLARDKSGLPLLGPFRLPHGTDAKFTVDIWAQKDWAIVRGTDIDSAHTETPRMAEWRDDYNIGELLPLLKGGMGFFPKGDQRQKMSQEKWKGSIPIKLPLLGEPGGRKLWAGTLTGLPKPKAKVLLTHAVSGGDLFVGSYNELAPTGANQDLPGHHRFNKTLVAQLLAVPASDQPNAVVDALPTPPSRVLLPGDICWADQGQTNNCGAFSFAAAMNFWFPYTNNPGARDGVFYSDTDNVPSVINGARTPANVVTAAGRFKMNGRDNDAEDLDRTRALKLLRLWLMAGVPVQFLVEEEYNLTSLHWKMLVGYDGDRFFMNNSGADNELITAKRTPGVQYEKAPIGNDVDSSTAMFDKWKSAGGSIVDAITSVDGCTFIPLFPKDPLCSGTAVL